MPFSELVFRAASIHRAAFDPSEVQRCTLLSIKTGGCTEDCKYCSQARVARLSQPQVEAAPLVVCFVLLFFWGGPLLAATATRPTAPQSSNICLSTMKPMF